MSTKRIRYNPPLTTALVSSGVFQEEPFFLIDVGASGGIEGHWSVFTPYLRAIGFDPLLAEVNRLNRLSSDPMIKYEAAFVGCNSNKQDTKPKDLFGGEIISPYVRSSAARAMAIGKIDYIKTAYNQGEEVEYTDNWIDLDSFFNGDEQELINFLKIDTDGSDYQVLLGSEHLLKQGNVLGISIEVQFHGAIDKDANLFSNIDRLLRKNGFSLFDLDIRRYSRADFPKPFVYDIPAETTDGQVVWGEAVYLRDFGAKNYEEVWLLRPTEIQILKLACLFEIFGLEDCCAELILKYKDQFQQYMDVDRSLDMLVPQYPGEQPTFVEYDREFENYVKNLGNEIIGEGEKFSQYQTEKWQIENLQGQLEQAQETIAAMSSSKLWKLRMVWFKLKRAMGWLTD